MLILAIVPPCARECRLVRVTGVLIFANARTCVAFVLLAAARSAIAPLSATSPGGPSGGKTDCGQDPSALPAIPVAAPMAMTEITHSDEQCLGDCAKLRITMPNTCFTVLRRS